MNVIETHALGKSYGSTTALNDCTVAIPEGHVAALVGPNGAGKTTFLNIAVGLDEDGIAALLANVLRDFRERRGGTVNQRGAVRHEAGGVA